jgi:hypothetical protein
MRAMNLAIWRHRARRTQMNVNQSVEATLSASLSALTRNSRQGWGKLSRDQSKSLLCGETQQSALSERLKYHVFFTTYLHDTRQNHTFNQFPQISLVELSSIVSVMCEQGLNSRVRRPHPQGQGQEQDSSSARINFTALFIWKRICHDTKVEPFLINMMNKN